MSDNDPQRSTEKPRNEVEASIDAILKLQGKEPIYGSEDNQTFPPEPPFCSFCGKGKNQVRQMLQGNNAYICNQCVALCQETLSIESKLKK